jgi:hypothetical protein
MQLKNKILWVLTLLFSAAALIIGFPVFRDRFTQHTINTLAQFTGFVMACIIVIVMPYRLLRLIWCILLGLISYQLMEDVLQMKRQTDADVVLPILGFCCVLYAIYDEFVKKKKKQP